MNFKVFSLPDPSGRMFKESYVLKNHKDDYDKIIYYCDSNNLSDISFKEKVYLAINCIKSVPVCKNINCDNKVSFKNSSVGYLEYCCRKCVSSDPNVIKKKEAKSFEKFGTKYPSQSNIVKKKSKSGF